MGRGSPRRGRTASHDGETGARFGPRWRRRRRLHLQRWHRMATAHLIVPLLFFLIQAADQAADRWPKLYSQALEQYNHGNFNVALADAAPAYQTWKSSPQSQ